MEPFAVVVADPPWKFNDRLSKRRGAESQYKSVMSLAELKAFELPPLADDCALFMWRVAAMQEDAFALMRAWDFTFKGAEIVWVKLSAKKHRGQLVMGESEDPWLEPSRNMGMGRIVRHAHEVCLIGHRGKPKRLSAGVRSVFSASVGRHSEKPVEFFHLVERLYAGPYVELFSRRHRDGWTCYGNELNAA